LAEVFGQLRDMFDLVLVDSPPLLPVTDAVILSQAVDTTLLVVAAGQTRGKDLRRAREALSLVHATIIGVVLNEVTRVTGYGYGYGKRYGYGRVRIRRGGGQRQRHPAGWRQPGAAPGSCAGHQRAACSSKVWVAIALSRDMAARTAMT
jgi:hypothetical protein